MSRTYTFQMLPGLLCLVPTSYLSQVTLLVGILHLSAEEWHAIIKFLC